AAGARYYLRNGAALPVVEPPAARAGGGRAGDRAAAAAVPRHSLGPAPHRHAADPARLRRVGDQLPRMEGQPAGAAPRATAAPLAPPPDPGHRHRGHRPARRGARAAVGGGGPVSRPAGRAPARDAPPPGLAGERADLAWTRTAIAFAALGAAILKYRPVVGLPLLVLSAVVWRLGRLPGTAGAADVRDRRLLLITVTTVGVSVVALVLSF